MSSRDDEVTVSLRSSMPKGYVFVQKGNVYITAHCRKKTHESGRVLYVVIDDKGKPIGLRCPQHIFSIVMHLNKETKASRRAAVEKKDANLEAKGRETLLKLFPRIPKELVSSILRHTLQKRSGRVGRTTTLPFEKSIGLAVRAHIRHKLTRYDDLLKMGTGREKAREKIHREVEVVAARWAGVQKSARFQAKNKS